MILVCKKYTIVFKKMLFDSICIEILYSIFTFMDIKDLVHLRVVNKHLYTLFKHSGFSLTIKRFQLNKDVVFKNGLFSGVIYKEMSDRDLYGDDYTSDEDDFLNTYSRQIIFNPKPVYSKKRKSYYPYSVCRISNKHYTELIHLNNNSDVDFSDYIDFKRTEEYVEKIFDQESSSRPLFNFRRTTELKGVIDLTYIIYSNLCIINDLDDLSTKERKLNTLLQLVCSCDNKIQLPQLPRFAIQCMCGDDNGLASYGHKPTCFFWSSEYIKACGKCSKAHIPYVHSALNVFNCQDFFTNVKHWKRRSKYWEM